MSYSGTDGAPPTKKPRLSLACNECRRRKVKCDADYPKCRNCRIRNIECFTSDPKHPGSPVNREWIEPSAEKLTPESGAKRAIPSPNALLVHDTEPQSDTVEVSPAHQPHEMFFSRDHMSNRMKMMGASSSACLTYSLNLYLRRMGVKGVSDHFRHGMRHAEELHLPLDVPTPALPPLEARERYASAYFERIHRLWPLFDIDATKAAIDQLALANNRRAIQAEKIPLLCSAYLIMSLGADEEAHSLTESGNTYLSAAAALMGHVLFVPYLPAVQTLLLFAIAYRGRNKDGLGWQTVGMAIRIAQSLGLHKHSVAKPSQDHGVTRKYEQLFHARIWAICCCLEKIMQLESGRPSAIGSINRDQMMGQQQRPPGLDYLQWNMGLAEYQAHISEHIYGHRPGDRTSRQILLDTARLDKALLDWSNELPPDFHPAGDLFCSDEDFHIAAHLSVQYHQAMIALHRAALIAPSSAFEAEVSKQCPNEPSRFRLKGGESICIELADRKTESAILTAGPSLLACVVLAIYLAKNPTSRMQAADLELLKACAEHVREQYLKTGQDERFAQGTVTVYEAIRQYLAIVRALPSTNTPAHQSEKRDAHQEPPQDATNANTLTMTSPIPAANANVPPPAYQDQSAPSFPSDHRMERFPETKWPIFQRKHIQLQDNAHQSDAGRNRISYETQIHDMQKTGVDIYGIDVGPVPFNEYSVEELWNWMLMVDTSQSPLESMGSQNHMGFM